MRRSGRPAKTRQRDFLQGDVRADGGGEDVEVVHRGEGARRERRLGQRSASGCARVGAAAAGGTGGIFVRGYLRRLSAAAQSMLLK